MFYAKNNYKILEDNSEQTRKQRDKIKKLFINNKIIFVASMKFLNKRVLA